MKQANFHYMKSRTYPSGTVSDHCIEVITSTPMTKAGIADLLTKIADETGVKFHSNGWVDDSVIRGKKFCEIATTKLKSCGYDVRESA